MSQGLAANAYEVVRGSLFDRVAAANLQAEDTEAISALAAEVVEAHQRSVAKGQSPREAFSAPEAIIARLVRDVSGLGAQLEELLGDPDVEEIYGFDGEILYRTTTGDTRAVEPPLPVAAVLHTVTRWATSAGEPLDASRPKLDGVRVVLPGGRQARLQASIAPRIDGTVAFTLRLPQKRNTTLDDLVEMGSITAAAATFLRVLMRAPRIKILIAGPPGGGKTTLIESLLRALAVAIRAIVLEEQRELSADLLNGEYWATSKVESLYDLIRSARVASPDLLVLGELKGPEAWELAMAGNLGTGLICAVHADSPAEAFDALAVAASPAVPAMAQSELRRIFADMFDVVIYADKAEMAGRTLRQVTEIAVVPPQLSQAAVAVEPIFARGDIGAPMTLISPSLPEPLERKCNRALAGYGHTVREVLEGAEVAL